MSSRMVRLGFEPSEGSCLFCLMLLVGVGLRRRCPVQPPSQAVQAPLATTLTVLPSA